jgi:hypothetical protein
MPETIRVNFVTGAVRRYVPEIEAIAELPALVATATDGRNPAWMREPADGDWSPARVVGHLIAYTWQSRENLYRMAYMTDPIMKRTDDDGQNEAHQWDSQTREALLGQLETAITEVVELLKELPDSSWGRPGQHPDDGRRSIKQHARAMRDHFDEHLAQLGKMGA